MKFFTSLFACLFILLSMNALAVVEPTQQASNIAFTNVTSTQMRVVFTKGNGAYRILVVKQTPTTSAITNPVDGSDYTASATFGEGSDLGSGSFVAYEGTNRAVTVTGLIPGNAYSFKVFEFNGAADSTNYLTPAASNNPRVVYTITTGVTGLTASNITNSSFDVSWTKPSGNVTGYQLDVATDASFTNILTAYNHLSVGTESNPAHVSITGLTQSTSYYWRVRTVADSKYSDWVNYGSPTAVKTFPNVPTIADKNICTGTTTVLTPTAPDPALNNFKFWASLTDTVPLYTGASYTTAAISAVKTYYISAVNIATGLESQSRKAVTVTPIAYPAPAVTGDDITCVNQTSVVYTTANNAGNTYAWTITGGTITAGATTNSATVTWSTVGTGTITVTETNATGCSKQASKSVNVQAIPNPVITGPASVCLNAAGVTYSITATANAINWEITNGKIVAGQSTRTVTVLWDTLATGKLKATETTTGGCSKTSADFSVTVVAAPAPNITGNTPVCSGKAGEIYSTANNLNNSYAWTVTGGTIVGATNTNSITVNWDGAATGTVKVRETNTTGCFGENTLTVVINPLANIKINGAASVCAYKTGVTYSVDTVIAGNTHAWTVTGGSIAGDASASSITVNWDTVGTGTVKLVEKMATGCETTVTKSVTKVAFPTIAFTGSNAVCSGSTAPYSVEKIAGNTYEWSVTGGSLVPRDSAALVNTPNQVSVVWGAKGTGYLTLKVTNSTSCSTSATDTVTIKDQPIPAIEGNGHLCVNATNEVYSTALTTGNKYAWTIVGGRILSGQDTNAVIVTWDSTGIQSISVTETAPEGCFGVATLPIDIQAYPAPVISGEATSCSGMTKTYSIVKNSDDEYNWSVTGGSIISGQGTDTIKVSWATAGNKRVSITEMTAAGCTATANLNVRVFATPAPAISGYAPVVEFDKAVVYSTKHDSTNLANTFAWDVEGGEIVGREDSSAIFVDWGENGAGTVTVIETTPDGCENTSVYDVTIKHGSLNKLVFTSNITKKISGTPFSVSVQAQTNNGLVVDAASDIPVTISVKTGTGTVIGAGKIPAGSSSTTINVTYTNNNGECDVVLSANGPEGMTSGFSNEFDLYAQEPAQATNVSWNSLSANSIGVTWTNGNGTGRLVLAKKTASFASNNVPTDGVAYDAIDVFGQGANINGAYAIYKGTGNSVLVTGLQPLTRYWFKVFEFKGNDVMGTVNYNINTVTGNPRTRMTPRIPGIGQDYSNESEDGSIFMSQISPNPAKDKIHFDIELAEETPVSVSVLTMDGRSILNPVNGQVLSTGMSHPVDINLGKLAAGSYILMVTAGDQMIVENFVVLP